MNQTAATLESTIFVYDGNQIALQFEHAGAGDATNTDLTHRYLWAPAVDQILADEQVSGPSTPGEVVWPLADHLGTVRDLAQYDDGTGITAIANHLVYDAFGQVESETNPAVDSLFLYTARPYDPDTALQNNLHRWYDLSIGRWVEQAAGRILRPRRPSELLEQPK